MVRVQYLRELPLYVDNNNFVEADYRSQFSMSNSLGNWVKKWKEIKNEVRERTLKPFFIYSLRSDCCFYSFHQATREMYKS